MKRLTIALFCVAQFFSFHFSSSIASAKAQDRGFIHPGGLHTQTDFDRVKAQLAAGNTKVKQAYAKLTSEAYAQASVQTSPTEIVFDLSGRQIAKGDCKRGIHIVNGKKILEK